MGVCLQSQADFQPGAFLPEPVAHRSLQEWLLNYTLLWFTCGVRAFSETRHAARMQWSTVPIGDTAQVHQK